MILDEYIQLSNAGIQILNHVMLSLGLMMTMTSFLFATVNSSHGNGYWAFLFYPKQSLKLLTYMIGIKKIGTIFFYFTERSDETRQRLIYKDMMQRLIPRQSRGSLRMQGSRTLGTLKILFKCIRFRNNKYIK